MSNQLPPGWTSAALDEIAEINPRHPKGLDDHTPVTFVRMAAISESKPTFEFTEERPLGEIRKGFTHFAEGDVLFAKITPCMENGKGAVARGLRNKIGCGTTEIHVVRPLADISPDYIYRFLAQRSIRRAARENFTGTAGQARVPTSFIEELELPLAPLAEQRRIVAKLEKVLGQVDICQERLAKIQALLKRFRQAILAAACSGRLTADWRENQKQDGEWPIHRLCELGSVTGGVTKNAKRQTMRLQVPYLRVANVYENRLELGEVLQIGVTQQEFKRTQLAKDDLLFVEGNGSIDQIGRVALWDGSVVRCVHQNHLIKFRAGKDVIPAYVLLQMMAPEGRSQLVEKATSSAGLNTLSISKISDVNLPVPPLAEQQEIARRVESFFTLAGHIEARFDEGRKRVNSITQAVLAKAFRGELVSTEFELANVEGRSFESAEELLERIGRNLERKRKRAKGDR